MLVDFSSGGLRIELNGRLDPGAAVKLSGEIEGVAGRTAVGGKCLVRWCSEVGGGLFHAGLSFEHASDIPRTPVEMLGNGVDYYEALQVSRRADADTIRRVYHLMAQRYHPDNRETGNDELFRQIVKANEVLSDQRAALPSTCNWHRTTKPGCTCSKTGRARGECRRKSSSVRQFCACFTTNGSTTPSGRGSCCGTLKT